MALTLLAPAVAVSQLNAIITTGLYVSIHTLSPGTTGANELVAGTVYSGNRPAITWGSITNGVVTSSNSQVYTLLLAVSGGIQYVGFWTASSGGTYLDGQVVSGAATAAQNSGAVITLGPITLTQAG